MKNLYIFLLLFCGVVGFSQKKPIPKICHSDEVYQELEKNDPSLKERMTRMNEEIRNFGDKYNKNPNNRAAQTNFTIPVVVYVVHANRPLGTAGNITDPQVQSQITALNNYFSGTGMNFCLAAKAGSQTLLQAAGNLSTATSTTPGIVHVNNTNIASHTISATPQVNLVNGTSGSLINKNGFLRIWIVESINGTNSNIAGYSYFPNTSPYLDGIVMDYRYFGDNTNIIPSLNLIPNYQQGKVLAHEVGHYLGLKHTFEGGCHDVAGFNSQILGDLVSDTPPVKQANFGCPSNIDSCIEAVNNLPDDISNYMDYTYDACKNHFTNGQKDRMLFHLLNYRNSLFDVDNLIFTGVCGSSNLVSSNFTGSLSNTGNSYIYNICSGSTMYFKPNTASTTYPVGTIVTYLWDFGNGITSTLENPSTTYSLSSNTFYQVTLSVTYNGNTSISSKNIFVNNCSPIINKVSTWYYSGKNILKFNTGIPRTNGTINFPGVGNSLGSDGLDNSFQNISIQNDDNGNVLFFTDGKDVFNGSNPAVKINSTMLFGGGETSQNTIILKSALNSNQYYIINNLTNTIFFPQSHAGIRYSIVNVNNGIASMSNTINIPIVPSTTQTGFITSTLDSAFSTSKSVQAVEKSDGGFWIITSLVKSDGKTYLGIFDFSTNGTIVLKNTFLLPSLFWLSAGNSYLTSGNIADLSISPNGNKIIYTYQAKGSIILDFDKYEGVLSQTTTFEYNDSLYTSFAFSPDSKLIYTRLGQMDLDAPVVRKNPFSETLNPRLSYAYGPDGKIYYLSFNNSTIKLGVIHKHNTKALIANPNSFINQEDFLKPEFDFSGNNYLPNFVHSKKVTAYDVNKISAYKTGCNSYKFFPDVPTNSIISAFSWNFGDTNSGVSNNTSTLNTPTHAFSASGTYTVTLTYNGNTTITTQVTITTFTPPAIQGTESRCVISGSATSFNSVALQDGQTVVWSILSGTGTILTNNQSEVQITWTQLPGTVKAIITDSSGCSGTVTKTITVLPNVTPTFNAIPAICSGNSLVLPTTSLNGITGVWRPAANNTETTTYTFNPNTVQCATTATLTVTVLPANDPSCTTAPCLPNLTLSVPETNSSIIYKRTNWIVANTNYNVGVNKTVTMKAGDYILLSSNIHILSGSNFSARIEACTAQSKSSNPQGKIVELKDAIIENEISVYPNPTRDLITISCGNQKMNNVTIFSVDGKTVFYKFNLKENILTLNTSSFKNGIYILTIETAAGQITRRKIIKE